MKEGSKDRNRMAVEDAAGVSPRETFSETAPYSDGIARIVDTFPILLASFDCDGRCLCVNKGAELLFKSGEIGPIRLQSILEESMGSRDSWLRVVTEALSSEGFTSMELSFASAGADPIRVFLKSQREGSDTSLQGVVALGVDRSLSSVQRSEMVGEHHLAMVAHELRNPLSNALAGLKILDMEPAEETSRNTRQLMRRQLDHLAGLVDDLAEAARSKAGKRRLLRGRTDAHHVVHLALQLMGESITAPGVSLHISIPPENLSFDGDAHRLAQVVSNLLDNAVKFSPDGGAIFAEATYNESEIRISVRDSGIGLTAEQQSALFRPFVQIEEGRAWSPRGLGLGLFIAKSIVEEHGGRIEVYSEGLQRGSSFSIILPFKISVESV